MFTDALIMDKTWEVPGGFLGFSARFARTGVQMYDGSEIDPDGEHKLADGARKFQPGILYPVDRPADEVFSNRALASFIAKPLTNDHPSDGVTIDDWNAKTKGVIGETLRDGEYARLSGLMTDKGLIADYRAGKKELSGGYSAKLVVGDGVNPAGQSYVAKQTDIDGNHVAFVQRGRAGSECRVADAAPCQSAPQSFLDSLKPQEQTTMKTLTIDGLRVPNVSDEAEAAILKLQGQIADTSGKLTTIEAKSVTDAATIVAKDAEITKLTADLVAAKLTPTQMRDAGKAYAIVVGKAKAAGITVTDEMDEGAIMKAVVDKAMPGNKYTADHIAIAFEALTKDVKVERTTDALRDAISGQPVNISDTRAATSTARANWLAAKENAHIATAAN